MAKVIEPVTSHKDHSPEIMTLDMLSITVEREGHTIDPDCSWLLQIHLLPSQPCTKAFVNMQTQSADLTVPHTGIPRATERGYGECIWAYLLVLEGTLLMPLSSALRPVDLSLSPSHLFYNLIQDLHAGKEGTWEAVFKLLIWLTGCVAAWKPRATPGLLGMGVADSQ